MKKYDILLSLKTLPLGASVRALSGLMSSTEEDTLDMLQEMAKGEDPLVYVNAGRWYIAGINRDGELWTGGHRYLQEVAARGHADPVHGWQDEALTGITKDGRRSTITRAVLPKKCCGCGCADAEKAANRANRKFIDPRVPGKDRKSQQEGEK
jgi:hypothetical protein